MVNAKVRRTSDRLPKRRNELLDAAAKVFETRGYAAASVQDIADELGLLKGSLYHYMSSKEDLLYDLLLGTHDAVSEILDKVSATPVTDPLRRLWYYVYLEVEYIIDNLPRISIYYRDTVMLGDERRRSIYADHRSHNEYLAELIAAATGMSTEQATIEAMNVIGTIVWTHRWFRPGRFDASAVPGLVADYAVRGIAGGLELEPWPAVADFASAEPEGDQTDGSAKAS